MKKRADSIHRSGKGGEVEWTEFQAAECPIPSIKMLKRQGMKKSEALAFQQWFRKGKTYLNSIYQVQLRDHHAEGWPRMVWLSIKRRDKEPIRDWRDLQRIKNELIGPENEAIELFPAESRLVDTSNQYHLYALKERGQRFPFGMNDGRAVLSHEQVSGMGAKQRDYHEREYESS